MKKIIVIFGREAGCTGKTLLARQMGMAFDNPTWICGRKLSGLFPFNNMNEDTDCVIIDDITEFFNMDDIAAVCTRDEMLIERKYFNPELIKVPKFIVTTSSTSSELAKLSNSTKRRIRFIQTYIEDGIFHAHEVTL